MNSGYIARTLIADVGKPSEHRIEEGQIGSIDRPIIILGDPGLGKTELAEQLQNRLGWLRVPGGTFYRSEDLDRFRVGERRLIIDGLDEIAASTGSAAIDEVLRKLSRLGNPPFVLSCRVLDWQSYVDGYKVAADYGQEAVTLQLLPFNYDEARTYLTQYDQGIDATAILNGLEERDLDEFYGNPLTLRLVAELAKTGQGLPSSRSDLFDRASRLLVREEKEALQGSATANASVDSLLNSAGAICAHILISGMSGVVNASSNHAPPDFIPRGELKGIRDADSIEEVLGTRMFRGAGENLLIPFHRVIAEFLAARWLALRLADGISERRLFSMLTFVEGIPTSVRGLHAWLAHFSPRVADHCIKTDPYGVLRYGDTDRLPLERARLLLESLTSLAEEDPYFRSEDWGKRAVAGLARPELKDDIVRLLRDPERHIHLSTLLLEAIAGSPLAPQIAPELLETIQDEKAAYIERLHSTEALIDSQSPVSFPELVAKLVERGTRSDLRLAIETVGLVKGKDFTSEEIAGLILAYERPFRDRRGQDDDETEEYVHGIAWGLSRRISGPIASAVLDILSHQIMDAEKSPHWHPPYELSSTIETLIVRVLEAGVQISPRQFWRWLQLTSGDTASSMAKDSVRNFINGDVNFRRAVQMCALEDWPAAGSVDTRLS